MVNLIFNKERFLIKEVENLKSYSDAYIEAVLYGKYKYKFSIQDICQAIIRMRKNNINKEKYALSIKNRINLN